VKKNGKDHPTPSILIGFEVGDGPVSDEELRLIKSFLAEVLGALLSGEDEEEE